MNAGLHVFDARTAPGEPRALVDEAGLRVVEVRPGEGAAIPRHAHDDFTVVVQLAGGFIQRMRGEAYEVGAGEFVTVPAGEPHEEVVGPPSRALLVSASRSWYAGDGASAVSQRVVRVGRPVAAPLVAAVAREVAAADDVTPGVLAAWLDRLLALLDGEREELGTAPPAWLLRVRAHLDDTFRTPLSIDDLARTGDVSRGHLTRAFRAVFGRSVGEYVRWRRVEAAARRLRATDDPLPLVALESGFYDQSHLNRLFKRHFGVTPLAYRLGS